MTKWPSKIISPIEYVLHSFIRVHERAHTGGAHWHSHPPTALPNCTGIIVTKSYGSSCEPAHVQSCPDKHPDLCAGALTQCSAEICDLQPGSDLPSGARDVRVLSQRADLRHRRWHQRPAHRRMRAAARVPLPPDGAAQVPHGRRHVYTSPTLRSKAARSVTDGMCNKDGPRQHGQPWHDWRRPVAAVGPGCRAAAARGCGAFIGCGAAFPQKAFPAKGVSRKSTTIALDREGRGGGVMMVARC